jgi:hypothetical protein
MWMRPEYVALLGHRQGVPWSYAWDERALAREVRERRVDYIVASRLSKTDLDGRSGDPIVALRGVSEYAEPALVLANPLARSDDFVLLKVDRARLERAAAGPSESAQQVVLEDAPDRAQPVLVADLLALFVGAARIRDPDLVDAASHFATLAVTSGSKPKRSSSISIDWMTSRRNAL